MCLVHQHEVCPHPKKPTVWWKEVLLFLLGVAMLAGIIYLGAKTQPEGDMKVTQHTH